MRVAANLFSYFTTQAHPATGIVVDRKGQVYFSDLETIWKIDLQGQLSVFRAGVSGRHVHELSIDEQDNIYGADVSYNPATKGWPSDVWKMTPEGKFTYLLEPTEHPPRGMSIWRDRQRNMYLVDQNNHTKSQTLLLRRSPDGKVTTLAGCAYGHKDGRGKEANFSSVGGMAFGPDGSFYLTDGTSVRKVLMDGTVTTLAKDLNFRTADDKPALFGGAYGSLAGLGVDRNGNVYVADAGNRRLLRIGTDGKMEVVYRTEPPFFPNGVVATPAGDIYVMEVGLTPPSTSSGPRVRKLSSGGKNEIVAVVGSEHQLNSQTAPVDTAGVFADTFVISYSLNGRGRFAIVLLGIGLSSLVVTMWKRKRRERQA
ncbi:MAG: hypothetical protein M3R69_06165 [Acidobacteriota bacterium]|nr:hypothetical protein [Acidobacteriota bacterium]